MPELDGSTGNDSLVPGDNAGTEPAAPVNVPEAPTPAAPPPALPKSDSQARISSLQAQLDRATAALQKANDEKNRISLEWATKRQAYESELTTSRSTLSEAAQATQATLDENEALKRENANLSAELARAQTLIANPDIAPYATLLPATSNQEELDEKVEAIRKARQVENESLKANVRSVAGQTPPAQPARVQAKLSPVDIDRALQEKLNAGDLQGFQTLMEEFKRQLS